MRHTPSAAREHTEVALLTQELNEALEQQSVTSELLGIISSGAAELEPIFRAILEKLRASMMTRWGPSIDGMLNIAINPPSNLCLCQGRAIRKSCANGAEVESWGPSTATKRGPAGHVPDRVRVL